MDLISMILRLYERVNEIRAAVVSITGATAGTVVGAVKTVAQPSWFTHCAPYFQVCAWSVAIIAGIVTIFKAIRNDRDKR